MKYNGEYDRSMTIQQHAGGYVISCGQTFGPRTFIVQSFEDAVNGLAQAFGLLEVGERVVVSATKEPKERVSDDWAAKSCPENETSKELNREFLATMKSSKSGI